MAVFSVTITEPAKLAGITAAREAYNKSKGADDPGPWTTDDEYVQFVMERAVASYAGQYGR
ncbi:MAG: hypothetical protein K2X72_19605 [Reyranella sp.]|nr:hypothetical protein [Reyranella sp.]